MVTTRNLSGLFHQLIAGFTASLSCMAAATVIGWLSPTLPRLLRPGGEFLISLEEASWLATIPQFGILISPMPAAMLADRIGRKAIILTTGPLFLVGWAIVFCFKSPYLLYLARLILGFGIGIVCTGVPMYLGEIATPNFRGIVTSMFCSSWWIGLIFEYLLGDLLSYKKLTFTTALISVFFLLSFAWQPETPYYYLIQNDLSRARESLSWLSCASVEDVDADLDRMKQSIEDGKSNKVSWKDFFTNPAHKKPLILMLLLDMVSMFCGLVPLSSYSNETLGKTGGPTFLSPGAVTVVMAIMMLIGSLCNSVSFDTFGRIPTYFVSCTLSGIFMFIIGTFDYLKLYSTLDMTFLSWIPLTVLIMFSLTSTVGMYPACAIYPVELFDTNVRAKAGSINTIISTVIAILPFRFYLPIENTFGAFVNFYFFAIVCFLGTIMSFTLLPETKGKSFEQIKHELQNE